MPSLMMGDTADTLPALRDAVFTIADSSREYTKEEVAGAMKTISRLELFDVLVDRAFECVWDEVLTEPDDAYRLVLEYLSPDGGRRETEYDFLTRTGMSRSMMYEKRGIVLAAVGLALNRCAAPKALAALGEWG